MRLLNARGEIAALLLAAAAAALAPFAVRSSSAVTSAPFPGWPTHYQGRALLELPLTPREAGFTQDFPGRVGRFSDGQREIIIRWMGAPTRLLHSAADCFRGSGYAITPIAARRSGDGTTMGCFRATLHGVSMTVCEVIRDERGGSWSDVSAWYWDGMLRSSPPPRWSFVWRNPNEPRVTSLRPAGFGIEPRRRLRKLLRQCVALRLRNCHAA